MPLATITAAMARGLTAGTIVSIAGNVAAFVPLGLLAPSASARWRTWPRVLGLGLGVSLAIEAAQLAISLAVGHPYRQADVDDLLLNVAGAAVGFACWRWRSPAATP
jgi:glycopeptide antibiotics resistance protein